MEKPVMYVVKTCVNPKCKRYEYHSVYAIGDNKILMCLACRYPTKYVDIINLRNEIRRTNENK